MSYRIPYKVKGGKRLDYSIPSYGEMTIDHYRILAPISTGFVDPLADLDYKIRSVSTFAGIPVDVLNARPMKDAQEVFDFLQDQCVKATKGSDAFNAAVKGDSEYVPPEFLTFGGKTYRVPYDLEMDTVVGQWVDWRAWEPPQHEADLIAEVLAFMLVEKDAKYSGTPKKKVAEMGSCLLTDAFDLCAFFFAKSERFRSVTNRRSRSFHTLLNALVERALRLLPSDTEASISSLPQPN